MWFANIYRKPVLRIKMRFELRKLNVSGTEHGLFIDDQSSVICDCKSQISIRRLFRRDLSSEVVPTPRRTTTIAEKIFSSAYRI